LPAVSNSSPLIWLSKIGKIRLLKNLYREILITEEVYREVVVRGLREGFSDALIVKESINQGWIKVMKLSEDENKVCQRIAENAREIHLGEAQAIMLAHKTGTPLLMDESPGRALSEAWSVKVRGTLHVILKALKKGLLKRDEAKEATLLLIEKGFRIEPKLLARILREIDRTQ